MDSLKPQEKSSVCFDKHYISNGPNTRQLKHQKINNVQRSVTNEQQRLSGNSGHYATIQDSSNENTLFTPKPGYHNATPAKRESSSDLYVSFNTGDRLPTSPNNERTPGYSYATNGEIHILRDSNNENHQSEQIQQLEHNGNDENSKHDANMSKYQSKGTDDSDDMYLQPNLRRIGESGNDMKISWLSEAHVYHEPDNGLGGTLTSTYDVCRVSSNKIVTAPNINEKKICSTFKIIPCVNLVLLVAAATASIVAVLMIGDLKAEEVESGLNAMKDPSGSCKPVVCEDIPVVPNGTESSKVINSTANIGTPECEIPGILTTETTSSPVNVGDSFYISCRLRESSCWQTVMVSRSDHSNDSVPNPLFSITYNHTSGIRFSATTFREKVSTFRDGVHLQLTFDTANCDDTGVYTCAVIVGDIQVPTDQKNTSTEIKVIERASIKEIIASTSYDQGDDANVVCKGLIGTDGNQTILGNISMRIFWNEQTSENINSVMNITNSSHCQVDVVVNASFSVTNDMQGAELQCIARGDDGSLDEKSILLNVTTTKKWASKIKEIIASTSYVQGDDANVVCKGLIGTDGNNKTLGNISMRIYSNEETSKDITSVIDLTNSSHRQVDALVYASFVITNDMDGAELQCIVLGDDGSRDNKSILLNVTTTKIQISPSAFIVTIGENFNISTELTYIRGWSTLELRKNCSGTESTIVSISKNGTPSNLTTEEHIDRIDVIDRGIDDTRARLTFQFQNITCSDLCLNGGDTKYISRVNIGDSWVSESIEFKMNPSVPDLTLGEDKVLKCEGNIGIPSHKMRIIEETYVLKLPGSSSHIYLNPETCENVETITHKVEIEGRRYQCVIIFTNGTILWSNEKILKDTDSSNNDMNPTNPNTQTYKPRGVTNTPNRK